MDQSWFSFGLFNINGFFSKIHNQSFLAKNLAKNFLDYWGPSLPLLATKQITIYRSYTVLIILLAKYTNILLN